MLDLMMKSDFSGVDSEPQEETSSVGPFPSGQESSLAFNFHIS